MTPSEAGLITQNFPVNFHGRGSTSLQNGAARAATQSLPHFSSSSNFDSSPPDSTHQKTTKRLSPNGPEMRHPFSMA